MRLFLLLLLLPGLAACDPSGGVVRIHGETMGTTFAVTLVDAPRAGARWRDEVERVLRRVEVRMSTWDDRSELSRFNALQSSEWFPVSGETAAVVEEALDVHRVTRGAFDPTVGPLVRLWGFARDEPARWPPARQDVARTLARVGARRVGVRTEPPALRKERPDVEVDLSGIAKGYGVDAVARRLEALGVSRYLVEVGGELRGRGRGPSGAPWRVAIERPAGNGAGAPRVVRLDGRSLATSGTYRNYVFEGRTRRSHIMDPRTGEPVRHDTVSVSVLAASAARADALATALLVLGAEAGRELAERSGWDVLFVVEAEGARRDVATSGFARYLVE